MQREAFNLFRAKGRASLRARRVLHPASTNIRWAFEDTFQPIVCWFLGHVPYFIDQPGQLKSKMACRRCHQYLEDSTLNDE